MPLEIASRVWSGKAYPRMGDSTGDLTVVEDEMVQLLGLSVDVADFKSGQYPVFNPRATAYGASGNGTSNDRAALQSCIDAAQNAAPTDGGAVVFIPRGTYLHDATLTVEASDVTVLFESRGARLRQSDSANLQYGIRFGESTGSTVLSRVACIGGYFDGNKSNNATAQATGAGIYVRNCQYSVFRDNFVTSWRGVGMHVTASAIGNGNHNYIHHLQSRANEVGGALLEVMKYCIVRDCRFENNTSGYGLKMFSSGVEFTQNIIEGLMIQNNGGQASDADSGAGLILDGTTRCMVEALCQDNGGVNISFRQSNAAGAQNDGVYRFRSRAGGGNNHATASELEVQDGATGSALTGAHVLHHCQASDTGSSVAAMVDLSDVEDTEYHVLMAQQKLIGIQMDDCDDIKIYGRMQHNANAADGHGITATDCDRVTLRDFYSRAKGDGAYYNVNIGSGCTDWKILGCDIDAATNGNEIQVDAVALRSSQADRGCRWRDASVYVPTVSSGATLVLPIESDTSGCVEMSGTATITDIDTRPSGTQCIIRHTDNAASTGWTHSSKLRMSASANFAYSNGDVVAMYKRDGTNWQEYSRTPVS